MTDLKEIPTDQLNCQHFKSVYEDLGISIPKLGCVMLKVDPIDVSTLIPQSWAHVSDNPDRFWVRGLEGGDHITLLYGLMHPGPQIIKQVNRVLTGWKPEVEMALKPGLGRGLAAPWIDIFPSPYQEEPYACLVLHVAGNLAEAHQRLSFLPHINTFPTYKPHLTLCYVEWEYRNRAKNILATAFAAEPPKIRPGTLDYGSER